MKNRKDLIKKTQGTFKTSKFDTDLHFKYRKENKMGAMNREDLLKSLIREAIILIKDEKIKKHIKNKYQEIMTFER